MCHWLSSSDPGTAPVKAVGIYTASIAVGEFSRKIQIVASELKAQLTIMLIALTATIGLSTDALAAGDCPTAVDEIATDRPDITNSSLVVPDGSLQIENGINLTKGQQSTVVDGTNTRLRFGVSSCTEVLVDLPSYAHSGRGPNGSSDVAPAIKTQLGPLPGNLHLSVTIGVGLPTGDVAVSRRGYEPYLQFPWAHELGGGWAIDGMVTAFWFPSEPSDHLTLESTFAVERNIGVHADVFAEFVGDYPSHAGPREFLNFGGSYRITHTQQLDIHTGFGIDRRAPTFFFGIGYSYRWDGLN
jgi:hypothetical protein